MIEYISYKDFQQVANVDEYYKNRWSYYQDVIYLLKKTGIPFSNAVDLGPYKLSVIKNSDTIDKEDRGNTTYIFNANKIDKWQKISAKQYDLFIGMQVFEHLKNQHEIWQEVKRISNYALISLPYMWNCYNTLLNHHGINEEVIYKWTKMTPTYSIISGGDLNSKNRRIICFYNFKES